MRKKLLGFGGGQRVKRADAQCLGGVVTPLCYVSHEEEACLIKG